MKWKTEVVITKVRRFEFKIVFFLFVKQEECLLQFHYRNVEFKLMLILHYGALKALSRFKYKYSLQILSKFSRPFKLIHQSYIQFIRKFVSINFLTFPPMCRSTFLFLLFDNRRTISSLVFTLFSCLSRVYNFKNLIQTQ